MRSLTAVLLLLALFAPAWAADPADKAAAGIRPEAIRAHVRFLADDLLEGRATGTRGYDLAARYVASYFESLGLEPAGDRGSYFQNVPVRQIEVVPAETSVTLKTPSGERPLKWGEDFVSQGSPLEARQEVTAPVVFVGYGLVAPEFQHDDYAGVEVKGKIAAFLWGAPASFPATQRAHYSSMGDKVETALARGAVGVIIFRTPEGEKQFPWKMLAGYAGRPGLRWLDPQGRPNDAFPGLQGGAMLSRQAAEVLFAGAPRKLDEVFAAAEKGKPGSFDLPVTATLKRTTRFAEVSSANVAAVLRGSDPKLKDEYVVFTAHGDHLGRCRPVNGDDICNGAVDNASGTAVLLELARAYAALPQRPRRSLLFLMVTGEEKGLLGSDYFANFPTVARQSIVANINMDGASILYPLEDVVPLGAEHSTLGRVVEEAAARMGLKLSPDPMPEQTFFIRSDQYSFVRQGVPALAIFDGFASSDPGVKPREIFERWTRDVYHTAKDDLNQPLDFGSAARYARLNFLVGYRVAQDAQRPAWKKGDFFGEKFGKK